MDLHESAVTAAIYVPDCPSDVIPALYSIGAKQMQQRRASYSTKVRTSHLLPDIIISNDVGYRSLILTTLVYLRIHFYFLSCFQSWPVTGGSIGSAACSYSELFITGSVDKYIIFITLAVPNFLIYAMCIVRKICKKNFYR